MNKKIILIFPRPISEIPMGFAYLNSVLTSKGWECKALVNTFNHYYTNDDFIQEIIDYAPSVVGINIGTLRLNEIYSLIKRIKYLGSNIKVIVGGPHATACPEEAIENGADIVVKGEGEETLSELCDCNFDPDDYNLINRKELLGIMYKDRTGIIFNNINRPYIKELSKLPKPNFNCFNLNHFKTDKGLIKGLHRIYCSRGCPNLCLSGSTIIHTINGDFPIKDLVGKETYVLTRDNDNKPIYSKAINILKIEEDAELVRVYFDDGSYIDCTPDHNFKVFKAKNQFIKETEWDVEAKDLLPKQSVRAVSFEKDTKGYINISTKRRLRVAQHRLVMEALLGRKLTENEVIHHKDKDVSNNFPSNLELTDKHEHLSSIHGGELKERMINNNPAKLLPKEHFILLGKMQKGKSRTLESRLKYRESKLGRKNPRYNPNIVKRQERKSRIEEVNHKITSVEYLLNKEDVYCMEVPEVGWFYANKVLVQNCTFCSNTVFGNRVRFRPIDDVIEDIKERYNLGIESFIIADDTFTTKKSYVKEFCNKLIELNLPIIWGCSTRANLLDEELLSLMRKAGCYLVGLGIESANPLTLELTKKHVTVEQADKAISLLFKLGFRVYVNLMVGFPWETPKAIQDNIDFVKRHFNEVFIYQVSGSLVPYPGTDIYEQHKKMYDIENWWLRPEYQNFGIQIHQNSEEPYKYSTYYQRHLYDDTYIWEDKFFKYSKKYKKLVKEIAFLIGKRNLLSEEPSKLKRFGILSLCYISRFVYERNTKIEKFIISNIVNLIKFKSKFHNHMALGAITKVRGKCN